MPSNPAVKSDAFRASLRTTHRASQPERQAVYDPRLFLRISRDTLLRAVTLMLLASGASLVWRAIG